MLCKCVFISEVEVSAILSMYLDVIGVGGIDKYSTSVFLARILRYYCIPTIGVADLQAPLNNMMRS